MAASPMDLRFEFGSPHAPAGHALLYFGSGSRVFATYVLVLPIRVNLEKYVPPALASMVQGSEMPADAATPMPPIAEEIESLDWLRNLAALRRDDLVDAGSIFSTDVPNLVAMTQEAAATYAELYRNAPSALAPQEQQQELFADMTESEILAEMTSQVGRLRDTSGTPDAESIQVQLQALALRLPSKYRALEVVDAARQPGPRGQQLATLQLQRCFKLLNEDYLDVAEIERQIKEIQND